MASFMECPGTSSAGGSSVSIAISRLPCVGGATKAVGFARSLFAYPLLSNIFPACWTTLIPLSASPIAPTGNLRLSASGAFVSEPIFSTSYQDEGVQRLLRDLAARSQDLTPAMIDIGEESLLAIDEGFEQEVDPNGIPWKPVSASTLEWKRQNNLILKTLQASGRLRASITYQAEKDRVVVGTNVKYAKKQQAVRPFIGIGSRLRGRIVDILRDHVIGNP